MIIFSCFDDIIQLINNNHDVNLINKAYNNFISMIKYSFDQEEIYMINDHDGYDHDHKCEHDFIIDKFKEISISHDTLEIFFHKITDIFLYWSLYHIVISLSQILTQ